MILDTWSQVQTDMKCLDYESDSSDNSSKDSFYYMTDSD